MVSWRLEGKTALVCGASKGIGAACCKALAERGARVLGLARHRDSLVELIGSLPGEGHQSCPRDLNDLKGLEQTADHILTNWGAVHVLVNNCGGPPPGPVFQAEPEAFLQAFSQHVLASSTLAQKLVPGMKEYGFGRIINIISTSVKMPIPNLGVSNTIRGAMASWSKTLARELGPFGITVNNVLPGYTDTQRLRSLLSAMAHKQEITEEEMEAQWKAAVPLGRFGAPEEVAAGVAFLASPAGGYINGINLPIDGGKLGCL